MFLDLFENIGLYREVRFWTTSWLVPHFEVEPIQKYCLRCKGERTWNEIVTSRCLCDEMESALVHDRVVRFVIQCRSCKQEQARYFIYFWATDPGKLYMPDVEKHGVMIKVGQFPAMDVSIPAPLRNALGKYGDIFRKGRICESQGFGIGSFAYYRRIVELTIDELLADIRLLLEPSELSTYDETLRSVEQTIVAQKKIALVKDLLPAVLRPGGNNPLSLLHDALSYGIHELDDVDCLALAQGIRDALIMLSKHIALAKEEKSGIGVGLDSLRNNLNRIRQKQTSKDSDGTSGTVTKP